MKKLVNGVNINSGKNKMTQLPRRYAHIYETIDTIRPQTILEIGVHNGHQARKMIQFAQKYHRQIRYYGFDLFEKLQSATLTKENPNGKGKSVVTFSDVARTLNEIPRAIIDLYRGYTHETLPKFRPLFPIDLIFIDGGHSLETIANDWLFCSKLIHKDSVILLDDYYPEMNNFGCRPLIEELQLVQSHKYKIEVLQPVDFIQQGPRQVLKIQMAKVTLI